jgi:hypothetical protein
MCDLFENRVRKKCQQRDDLERQIEPKIARGKACQESKVPLSKKVEEQSSHSTPRGRSEKFIWTHLA